MDGFNAGALIFMIKSAGAQIFKQDMRDADQAIVKTGDSAAKAGKDLDRLGDSTDGTAKKSRAAKQPLEEHARATEKVGNESRKSKTKQDEQAQATERQAENAKRLSVALLAAGVAVTALVGLSVAKWATFDQAMSQTAAATMATAAEQEKLGDAALEAGADTAYSATEAAHAEEELAKAGLNTAEIVGGGLTSSLALAAAGQLEVARSATIMATTLKQFGLEAGDASHVADLLAAGAGKAQGSVDDLANAMKFVGPVANSLGLSLEETTGILAMFAEQGIIGEQAGTSLRGVLSSLTSPSSLAAKTMEQYGIQLFDANGKMKSGAAVAEELHQAFVGLTDAERQEALGRIFGNEQITAATILMRGGAKAVEEWTEKVNDSGYAADQAAMRQDNLAGDVEKLGGAFETALIKSGSGANDVLRDMVQGVTALVDWFGELPDGVQTTGLVLGVATAAMLLFSGATLGAVTRFMELRKTLELTNLTMGKTALIAGGVGLALTGVLTVVALVASAQAEARQKAEAYATTLEEGTFRITDATRDLAKENLAAEQSWLWMSRGSAYDAAEKLGLSLETVTDAATGNVDALRELESVIKAGSGSQVEAQKIADDLGLSLVDVSAASSLVAQSVLGEKSSLEEAIRVAEQKNQVTEEGVPITESAATAYLDAADGAQQLGDEINQLIDRINEANGVGQDAVSANAAYKDALAGISEEVQAQKDAYEEANGSLDGYRFSLDESTVAGSANADMLSDVAAKAQASAEATYQQDLKTMSARDAAEKYAATLETSRQALIDQAIQNGATAEEVQKLIDKVYDVPSQKEVEILAQTGAAQQAIDSFIRDYSGRQIPVYVTAMKDQSGRPMNVGQYADGGIVQYFAGGGMRENHVAQFARAGSYRVWAEPETGGEAYIPMSPAKRAGSTAILADVAAQFGYQLVPSGSRSGGGGAMPPARQGGSSGPLIGAVYMQPVEHPEHFAERVGRVLDRRAADEMAGSQG
ncbi:phage tail tape measure protein [Agromyces sp. NPDC058104]|uniref:phage tail tape measure protein n=1 Tax=Agromyces sp. NPDC058104 TaxID=3346342 RepID=UPI0036DECC4F